MITQKQIAQKAGVSRQLVGHALQGRPNVSEKTKLRIYAAARELGYHPDANWSARILLAKRHTGMGVGSGKVEPEKLVAPPIYYIAREPSKSSEDENLRFVDFFNGFVKAFSAWKRGFELICPLDEQTDLDVVRNVVETGRSSGIINLDLQADATAYLVEKRFPMVVINSDLTARGVPSVIADHAGGYMEAWRAAAQAGHRRIVFVGYSQNIYDGKNFLPRLGECVAGAAAAKVGRKIDRAVAIPQDGDKEGIWNAFAAECGTGPDDPRWPTLAFTQNDMCAKSLIASFRSHGMEVPRDISVIGFDDAFIARHFDPPLATLSKPRFDMAMAAAQLLSDVLAERPGCRQKLQTFPIQFVVRESFAALTRPKGPMRNGGNGSKDQP